eukprot:10481306-Karenia_brevis.AAC.1
MSIQIGGPSRYIPFRHQSQKRQMVGTLSNPGLQAQRKNLHQTQRHRQTMARSSTQGLSRPLAKSS